MGIPDTSLRHVLAWGTAIGVLLGGGLPASAESRPRQTPSRLERGLVYVRMQGPGFPDPVHRNFPADVLVEAGVMLDNPARTTRPLLLERMRVGEEPLLVLERQLSSRSRALQGGTLNQQRIQVLDVHPLPQEEVEIIAGVAGMAACLRNDRPDTDVVAIRRLPPEPRAGSAPSTGREANEPPPLLQAWVVDRRGLRLRPLAVGEVSCPTADREGP